MGGGKKRKQPSLKDLLERPWCYYCERDFDDQKILVDHQKAKHYHCQVHGCHRKLGTAGGLRVHMQQVHKEDLLEVPNAIAGREDPNLEIFAMVGIPEAILNAYKTAVTNAYEAAAHKFRQQTGNFLPGSIEAEEMPVQKKRKTEQTEEEKAAKKAEILRRKEEVLARKRAAAEGRPASNGAATPTVPVAAKPVTPVPTQVYNTPPAPQAVPPQAVPPPSSGIYPPAMVQSPLPRPPVGALPPFFPPPMPPNMPPNMQPKMQPNMPPTMPFGHASPVPNVSSPAGLPFMPPPGVRGPPMPSGFSPPPGFNPPPGFSPPAHMGAANPGVLPGLSKPPTASSPPQPFKSVTDQSTSDSFADGMSQLMDEAQAKANGVGKESSRNSEPNVKAEPSASQSEKAAATGKKKAEKVSEKPVQPLADNITSFEEARARHKRYATDSGAARM